MDPYDSYSNSELNLKFIEYKLSVIHTNISVLKKYVINVWKKKVATASNVLVKELIYQEIVKKVIFTYLMITSPQVQYTTIINPDEGSKCEDMYVFLHIVKGVSNNDEYFQL